MGLFIQLDQGLIKEMENIQIDKEEFIRSAVIEKLELLKVMRKTKY